MTLFKQIVLLLSLFVLVLLLTVMSLNFRSAAAYVQDQLYTDAQDTAASLSLSLGSAEGDVSTMTTMVNAVFDSGYYRHITLNDMSGAQIYKREAETTAIDVPAWFMDFVDLKAPTATAQVSSGWTPVAILEVTSSEHIAYGQLFETFRKLIAGFALLSVITFVLLYLLLHIVLKSVTKVQQQAEAISNNDFITNDEIPFTTEFKDATLAMNAMVLKVKDIFTKEAKTLKQYHALLYKDPVTDLANRRLFTLRLGEYLRSESKKSEGTLLFMAFDGLSHLNDTLGHPQVDAMLKAYASQLKTLLPRRTNAIIARLNGTEFAVIIPTLNAAQCEKSAKEITMQTELLLQQRKAESLEFFTGLVEYHAENSLQDLFSRADYALTLCRQQGNFSYHIDLHDDEALKRLGKHEWSELISDALETRRFSFDLQPVLCEGSIYHEEAYLRLIDEQGTIHNAGSFMPVAHALEMESAIDRYSIDTLLNLLHKREQSIAINLSAAFILESSSLQWLQQRLDELPPLKALYFETSNHDVLASVEACALFAKTLKRYGHHFGIDKFTVHENDLTYLQQIKPTYIKVDHSYLHDMLLNRDSGIENNALNIIMESLDITLIATAIEDEESKKRMQQIGIRCFEGRHIAPRYTMG